ncbi:unnamed protein product [Symbiodinium sp. CCMP2592]|nr:unnamed protein product [Symbiodinium sp. CCMP2592]
MPQPQGYKKELDKANVTIVSIEKALFHGSFLLPFFACLGGGAGRRAASVVHGNTQAADGAKGQRDSAPGVVGGAAEVPKHGCWCRNLVHDQS